MDAMVEAMKPYIGMIFAIWFISEVITAMSACTARSHTRTAAWPTTPSMRR